MQPEDTPRAAPPTIALYGREGDNQALAHELTLDGFDVRLVSDPTQFGEVDLIVFAHTSETGAGLGALRALRQGELAGSGARALWLSRTDNARDILRAFEAGADDVIRAPFVYAELLVRARMLLRRRPPTPVVIRHRALTIDTAQRTVTYSGKPVGLRRREFMLLAYLAREPQRVYTKDELLREVWDYQATGTTRTVDSHACRLRRALANAGAYDWVRSSWGVGYCLAPRSPQPPTGGSHQLDKHAAKLIRFGANFRQVREHQRLSISELAARAGIEIQRIRNIEAGRLDPTFDVLIALARGMGVRLSALVLKD
jgi:DNA-binding response OmpR family regulator/DNA-binding XRE family transcriptional regulator